MELKQYFYLLKRKMQTIISIVIIFLVVALLFTIIQPFLYKAETRAIIVQNNPVAPDPYVLSKANEYFGNILAIVIHSEYFFRDVLRSGYDIDSSYFGEGDAVRIKNWTAVVDAKAINDTGIISINVYHKDKFQAVQIAEAVNYVLKTKNALYLGPKAQVEIRVIDQPKVSNMPVKPNILANLGLGLILGIIISLIYIYLFPENKFNLRLTARKNTIEEKKVADNWMSVGEVLEKKSEAIFINLHKPIIEEKTEEPNKQYGTGEKIEEEIPERQTESPAEINYYVSDETEIVETDKDKKFTYDDFIKNADINKIL